MQSASVRLRSKIYVGREVFSVPKHVKSVLYYILYYYILYIILTLSLLKIFYGLCTGC